MPEPRKRLWEVTVTWTATGYAWAATRTEAWDDVDAIAVVE